MHAGRFRLAPQDQADAPADVEDSHLMIPGPQRRGTAHDRKISFRDVRRPPDVAERNLAVVGRAASLGPGDHQVRIFDIRRRVGLVLRREPEPPRVHDPRWLATPLT